MPLSKIGYNFDASSKFGRLSSANFSQQTLIFNFQNLHRRKFVRPTAQLLNYYSIFDD